MNSAFAVIALGLLSAGLACAIGIVQHVLWPKQQHDRTDALLLLIWRIGLVTVGFGIVMVLKAAP